MSCRMCVCVCVCGVLSLLCTLGYCLLCSPSHISHLFSIFLFHFYHSIFLPLSLPPTHTPHTNTSHPVHTNTPALPHTHHTHTHTHKYTQTLSPSHTHTHTHTHKYTQTL